MRTYRSPMRAEQAASTRAAILAAFADQLGRPGVVELSLPTAAEQAGVSLRTVYHHFPDHDGRLTALGTWAQDELDAQLGPMPPIAGVDDLPDHVRRTYARAARRVDLARATYLAGVAEDVRTRRLRARRLDIAALLTGLGAPAEATARAIATVSVLASSEAGIPLVDTHGLTMEEAGEAAAQAVAAIIGDLRSRRREMIGP
jgi:AcrR family transcriptional regulator